ncbi:MAG TPA: hypothetical protein VLG16_02615 [Candidatus Saccharimonadales bacterium]|nr:hypothetical protein [Candidatus Saccharimonadales bacterium]
MRQSEEYITDRESRFKIARGTLSGVGLAATLGFGIAGINHAIWQGRNNHEADKYISLEAQMPSVDPLSEDANDQKQLVEYYNVDGWKNQYMGLADGQAEAKDGDFTWAAVSFGAAIAISASIIYKKAMGDI